MHASIAVYPTFLHHKKTAEELAAFLHLPYISNEEMTAYDYLLLITDDYIGLQNTRQKNSLPLFVDFSAEKMRYRCQTASTLKEALPRALGLKKNISASIIDATGGLARDSFLLASLGYEVIVLERSPIIYTLLIDGIKRAMTQPAIAAIAKRLQIIHADATQWLNETIKAEYIYLDPMFPERKKSALVKKDMRFFHDIIGQDEDADRLLERALACATKRVVVKRPRLAPPLAARLPSFDLPGKSSRFDIYLAGQT